MDIIDKIDKNNLTFEESFSAAQYCSQLLSNGSISDNLTVRTIAITHSKFMGQDSDYNLSDMDRYYRGDWLLSISDEKRTNDAP